MGKLSAHALVAGFVVLLVGSAAAQQRQTSAEAFTAGERTRLDQGRLVRRPTSQRRGQLRLIGGSAWRVADQPLEVVWRALVDERAYVHMLPAADDVRVVSRRPGERVMRIRHVVGFVRASYHLRFTYDHHRHDIAFRLDRQRANDLRAAWGFIRVTPFEGSATRTLISYGVMADPGSGMFSGVMRPQIHDSLLRVPSTIRRYVQSHRR